jgi:hypothetical protein
MVSNRPTPAQYQPEEYQLNVGQVENSSGLSLVYLLFYLQYILGFAVAEGWDLLWASFPPYGTYLWMHYFLNLISGQ